jgi:hypothetical protein
MWFVYRSHACGFSCGRLRFTPRWRLIGLGRREVRGNFLDFVLVLEFHEIGNIQEGVAFKTDIHESGLHAGKNAGYAAFVDGTS